MRTSRRLRVVELYEGRAQRLQQRASVLSLRARVYREKGSLLRSILLQEDASSFYEDAAVDVMCLYVFHSIIRDEYHVRE
jgi:hypothetical protein